MHTPTKCHQCGQDTMGVELSEGSISSICEKCWAELQADTRKAARADAVEHKHANARKRPR